MKIKLGVMFGGCSVEHEISIISALQAMENLNKEKYDVIPIYISKNKEIYTGDYLNNINNYKNLDDITNHLKKVTIVKENNDYKLIKLTGIKRTISKIDFILPIVHGKNVEDGSLAGYLETIGIPYAFSSVLSSSIGQDKVILKELLEYNQIPIVPYVWFYENDYINNKNYYLKEINKLIYPVIVKPARLGSSIGISFINSKKDIEDAINNALVYDDKIIIEKAVTNLKEINCSVLKNKEDIEISNLEEVKSGNNYLTFEDKYIGKSKSKNKNGIINSKRSFNISIAKSMEESIKKTSKEVFKILDLNGVCRIDYLIDTKSNKFYVNEPNIIPGSLAYYLWDYSYQELLDKIIEDGIYKYNSKVKKLNQFDSNVLSSTDGLKNIKNK